MIINHVYSIPGCINSLAMNYNPDANQSDGSCIFPIYGCTNEFAINYLSIATIDNGLCIEPVYGCIYDYPFIELQFRS